jgi:uncharacterized protein
MGCDLYSSAIVRSSCTSLAANPLLLQKPPFPFDGKMRIADGFHPLCRFSVPLRLRPRFKDYLRLLIDRDARDVANIEQLGQLPSLLAHLAEQAGSSVNISNLATSLKLSRQTVARYVEALERMFLVRSLQPWHSNKISRITKTPKLQFFDSGLLAAQLGVADLDPLRLIPSSGALFETFVHGELRKMMGWSETRMAMYHFRTREGDEVDFVIEGPRGQVVGIEVKSSATLKRADFSGLRKLEEAAGDKFVYGLLLHDHDRITPYSERIRGAPLSWLWQV